MNNAKKINNKLQNSLLAAAKIMEALEAQKEAAENRLADLEAKLAELLCHVTGGRFSKTTYSIEEMKRFADDCRQEECEKCEELEQVKRERDAAVADVKSLCATNDFSGDYCAYCKYREPDGQCFHECMLWSGKWGGNGTGSRRARDEEDCGAHAGGGDRMRVVRVRRHGASCRAWQGVPRTIPVPSGYVPDERVPYEVVYGDDGVDVIIHFLREAEE